MESLFLIGYYIAYFIIGIGWTIYVLGLIEDDPKYRDGYSFEISLVSNFLIWPVCMLAVAFSRIFLGRDTLFVDKEEDD